MIKKAEKILGWDIPALSKALHLSEEDIKLYFTDGRKVSFIYERRVNNEYIFGKLAPSEKCGYDLIDKKGNKWEIRCITKDGVYFSPSNMVGKGRKFAEIGFLGKLKEIKGYILADVDEFPNVSFWIVDKEDVFDWYKKGLLGKNASPSKKKILELLNASKK